VFFKATKNTKGTNRAKVPVGERRDHQPDWQPPGQAVRGSVARSSSQGQVALGRTTADREDVTLYTLRHSHASALHPAGFTLPEAARRLGPAVAEHADVYAHVIDSLSGERYAGIDALIAASRRELEFPSRSQASRERS